MTARFHKLHRQLRSTSKEKGSGGYIPLSGWTGYIQTEAVDPDNPDVAYVLDLLNNDTVAGTQVVVQPFVSGKPTQHWWYVEDFAPSAIQNIGANNLNLGIGSAVGEGYYLVLVEDDGDEATWTTDDDGTILNGEYTALAMDVDEGIPKPNVAVIAYPLKTPLAANQQWTWGHNVTDPPPFVTAMQGTTITEGWDAVVAISVEQVNSLFQTTFAQNYIEGQTASISTTVGLSQTYAQLIKVILGSPLIQFLPENQSQQASLTIPVQGGLCLEFFDETEAVVAVQVVTASQNYVISGNVPLSSVQGEVKDQTEVILDIANGESFSAQLGYGQQQDQSALGTALQSILAGSDGYNYSLGTISSASGGNLAPVSFAIGTQVSEDPDDLGRVLLFITTENGTPGSTTSLSVSNLVPPGYSAALLISSQKFFASLLHDAINTSLTNLSDYSVSDLSLTAEQLENGAYGLVVDCDLATGLTVSVFDGQITWSTGRCLDGVPDRYGFSMSLGPVIWSASPANVEQLFAIQDQGIRTVTFVPLSGDCQEVTQLFYMSYNATYTPYIDTGTNDIIFGGGVSYSLQPDTNPTTDGFDPGAASSAIQAAAQTMFGEALNVSLPDITTFALRNLLFPNQSNINLETVYLPGDLVTFGNMGSGNIQISPSMPVLVPNATVTFTATVPSGGSVTWSAEKGSIDQNGVYTAPGVINRGSVGWITATSEAGESASTVVALEPNGMVVNPLFLMVFPGEGGINTTQTFTAAGPNIDGASVSWSVSAGAGSIDGSGDYTAPGSIDAMTAATVTATTGGVSSSSNLLIFWGMVIRSGVAPAFIELKKGGTQLFSTQSFPEGTVTWSVFPSTGGTVDGSGNYTAPSVITNLEAIAVVATVGDFMSASAVVLLDPD
jgi:hypothetical protein